MAIPQYQRKAIDLLITRGKELPANLASAVVAALDSEESTARVLRGQVDQAEAETRSLLLERDETQRLRREVEEEIERRVSRQTTDLEAANRNLSQERDEFRFRLEQKERISQKRLDEQVRLMNRIDELENLLGEQQSLGWVKLFFWRRKVRRYLQAAFQAESKKQTADTQTPSRWARWSS